MVLPFVVAGRPTVRPKYASAISAKCGLAGGAQGIVSRSVVTWRAPHRLRGCSRKLRPKYLASQGQQQSRMRLLQKYRYDLYRFLLVPRIRASEPPFCEEIQEHDREAEGQADPSEGCDGVGHGESRSSGANRKVSHPDMRPEITNSSTTSRACWSVSAWLVMVLAGAACVPSAIRRKALLNA